MSSERKVELTSSIYENAHKKLFFRKERKCPLSKEGAPEINYKNVELLSKFISDRGRILPNRITAVSSKKQRELKREILKARILALMPFVKQI